MPRAAGTTVDIGAFELGATSPDSWPSVAFDAASQSAGEGVGTVLMTVQLSAVAEADVTVPFTVDTGSTATAGADYTIDASPLVIPAGATSGTIMLTVKNDLRDEPDETVIVQLGLPTGAKGGDP